jgi:hypothetical protein
MTQPKTYGHRRRWAPLYDRIVNAAPGDLHAQLQALIQAGHDGADPDDVNAVKAALFAVHGQTTAR